MLLDSAEAVLSVFGFNSSLFGFERKKTYQWWDEIYQQHERDIESSKAELWNGHGSISGLVETYIVRGLFYPT